MKRLLLALILSFLIFINVRLWGVREVGLLIEGFFSGRATCDMPYPPEEPVSLNNTNNNCQDCEGQTRLSRLKACLARAVVLKKYKEKQEREAEPSTVQLAEIQDQCVPEYKSVHQMFKNSIAEFIACPSYNELTLQQLIDLVSVELKLIEVLIYPTMGSRHHLIQTRSDLIGQAVPSVRLVYDKILSLACHNEGLNNQYEHQAEDGQTMHLSLNHVHKKMFLHAMYQRIFDLKKQIKNMQYKLALS